MFKLKTKEKVTKARDGGGPARDKIALNVGYAFLAPVISKV